MYFNYQFTETFKSDVKTFLDQIARLSMKENLEAVQKMSDVLKRMRDNLINLEYEDIIEIEEITHPDEMYEDVKTAEALLEEISSEENVTMEDTVVNERCLTKTHQNKKKLNCNAFI